MGDDVINMMRSTLEGQLAHMRSPWDFPYSLLQGFFERQQHFDWSVVYCESDVLQEIDIARIEVRSRWRVLRKSCLGIEWLLSENLRRVAALALLRKRA